MTTNNHPAHGPVSLDRLHQISEILSKAAQSAGGNLGYAMADAVKVIDSAIAAFGAEPVAWKVVFMLHGHDGSNFEKIFENREAMNDVVSLHELGGFDVTATPLYRAAMLQAGNSPATPDCWISVSERMPDDDDFVYIWPRPDFGIELHVGQYCECHPKGDGWYAQVYEQNYGIEWHPIIVTHWMPLPNPPKE